MRLGPRGLVSIDKKIANETSCNRIITLAGIVLCPAEQAGVGCLPSYYHSFSERPMHFLKLSPIILRFASSEISANKTLP